MFLIKIDIKGVTKMINGIKPKISNKTKLTAVDTKSFDGAMGP